MRVATTLLSFVAVEGVLITVLLALSITFCVHLVFVFMPAPVSAQIVVNQAALAQDLEALSVEDRLRAAFEQDAHALWLRKSQESRVGVANRLLTQAMSRDAERLSAGDHPKAAEVGTADSNVIYLGWLGDLLRFDLGTARSGQSVVDELKEKAPLTFQLSLAAYLAAIFAATWVALVRAFRPRDSAVQIGHYLT
ncbi:MAG: hypothetical protein GY906_14460, partial [bacterium]|nr:hypothetical protein [bacterium]